MLTKRLMASSDRKRTPQHLAVNSGEIDLVTALLEAGADPAAQDDYGQTPLYLAEEMGYSDIVNAIQKFGANRKLNT